MFVYLCALLLATTPPHDMHRQSIQAALHLSVVSQFMRGWPPLPLMYPITRWQLPTLPHSHVSSLLSARCSLGDPGIGAIQDTPVLTLFMPRNIPENLNIVAVDVVASCVAKTSAFRYWLKINGSSLSVKNTFNCLWHLMIENENIWVFFLAS